MDLHQRITDRPAALELADLTSAVLLGLLNGDDVEVLDCLDYLTESAITLRTTVANQIGAQS